MPHGIFPESLARLYVEGRDCGRQWTPSNGTEGHLFLESWCGECARDRAMRDGVELDECDDDECCDIIAASFRGDAKEWQIGADGQPRCVAFIAAGQATAVQRCEHTLELPF